MDNVTNYMTLMILHWKLEKLLENNFKFLMKILLQFGTVKVWIM